MKFLNYGSINIDHVYRLSSIVRPGETVFAHTYQLYPGGKGANQSVALARAGAQVWHAGKLGENGRWLLQVLQQVGVCTDFIVIDPLAPTGHALIQVADDGENSIVVVAGTNHCITQQEIDLAVAGDFQMLLLQNEVNMLPQLVEAGLQRGLPVLLNPSPFHPQLERLPLARLHSLLLNETEAMALAGYQEVEPALLHLAQCYPQLRVVVTLGSEGVLAHHRGRRYYYPARPVRAVDTTAAGDTFTGYFCAAFFLPELYPRQLGEDDLACALRVGTIAAAQAVTIAGAISSIPTREVVLALL